MRPADIRALLEPIGCWPATCHSCGMQIDAEEEIAFSRVTRTLRNKELFAVVHKRCDTMQPTEPTDEQLSAQEERSGRRSGGGYLTAEQFLALA